MVTGGHRNCFDLHWLAVDFKAKIFQNILDL